jgi:hypothetical protein
MFSASTVQFAWTVVVTQARGPPGESASGFKLSVAIPVFAIRGVDNTQLRAAAAF